jgi:cytochrome c5
MPKYEGVSMNNEVDGAGNSWFARTSKLLVMAAAMAFVLSAAPQRAKAQGSERSGKDVVEAVCLTCHGKGANGAPKIGDKKAWAARAARGLTGLSQNALNGIRKMPSHGGNPGLSDIEIERAVTYMVNASGGRWAEPVSRTTPVAEHSGEQIVRAQCFKCHETGTGGAPKIGDRAAWAPRATQGFEVLIRSAINGHGGMPPRGGVANLTDTEIRAAITYMLNPVAAGTKAPPTVVAKPDPNHKIIDGTEIYFGVTSAESIRKQHPGADPESAMHGGIPSGSGFYHLNISLFDTETKAAIKDAYVELKVADPVMGNQVKTLEPMLFNNSVSYGNYFHLPGTNPYTIAVLIRKPGASRSIETKFGFRR